VKQEVAAAVNALLAPMRERRAPLEGPAGDERVLGIIAQGVKRANAVAEETLYLAKKAMGMDFGRRTLG
jgi:tryptophanyl-tRNA synthetase